MRPHVSVIAYEVGETRGPIGILYIMYFSTKILFYCIIIQVLGSRMVNRIIFCPATICIPKSVEVVFIKFPLPAGCR